MFHPEILYYWVPGIWSEGSKGSRLQGSRECSLVPGFHATGFIVSNLQSSSVLFFSGFLRSRVPWNLHSMVPGTLYHRNFEIWSIRVHVNIISDGLNLNVLCSYFQGILSSQRLHRSQSSQDFKQVCFTKFCQ